ncbi:response regulator transcription factor [Geomicrobium sediminis]|uniref:Heme response regulator HssR n=1 Tax=Geomicrobium sediminis TaxID=1347788 RepID=A0ABS2P9W4_9BACL|nr:response regulator transcription factor [Geomicrobium sediminis]MBM7632097.1 DNA-binding response OmpR family regulator [Geomicrobium sediminis]
MTTVLLADDDANLRGFVREHLQREGYHVIEAKDGVEALEQMETTRIQLAIVDLMMPKMSGYELAEQLREHYEIPILMLTAKDQLRDKERGFAVGTDDYMTKPFEVKELAFRMKALLRRYHKPNEQEIIVGDLAIDRKSFEVRCEDRTMFLPLKEFELLSQLASFPGRTFTREILIELVWGFDYEGDDRTVDVHIKRLRERFSEISKLVHIKTVRGVGYKLDVHS